MQRRFNDRGALIHHIKTFHKDYPPAPKQTGRSTYISEQTALQFYRQLFPSVEHVQNASTTSSTNYQTPEINIESQAQVDIESQAQLDMERQDQTSAGEEDDHTTSITAHQEDQRAKTRSEPVINTSNTMPIRVQGKQKQKAVTPLQNRLQVPIYKATNSKRGQYKGKVNKRKCQQLLQEKGLLTLCSSCTEEGLDSCQLGDSCQSWVHFNIESNIA